MTRHRPDRTPSRPRALVATLLVLLAALAGSAPAHAASQTAEIASDLRRSPVYVDRVFASTIDRATQRRLVRDIGKLSVPVYVLAVPLVDGDAYGGDGGELITAVAGRLERSGVYLSVGGATLRADVEGDDRNEALDERVSQASWIGNFEGPYGEPAGKKVTRFVSAMGDPDVKARYDRVRRESAATNARTERLIQRARDERAGRTAGDRDDGGGGTSVVLVVLGVVALIAVIVLATRWLLRLGRATPEAEPAVVIPRRVLDHARAGQLAELRDDLRDHRQELATAIEDAPVPEGERAQAEYQRALDASDACTRLIRGEPPMVTVVGAIVLCGDAEDALTRAAALEAGRDAPPKPRCVFHPLHRRATDTVTWEGGIRAPACYECAATVRKGGQPEALRIDGEPYFERDDVWARTGFGALADDLVERVARGER